MTRYRYDGGPAPESWLPSSVQAPGAAASEAEALPGQGVPVRFSWSAMLRPESVTDSGGATTRFDFDAEGNLLALTPPATPAHDDTAAHLFTASGWDQLASYTPPAVPKEAAAYRPTVLPPASHPRLWVNENSLSWASVVFGVSCPCVPPGVDMASSLATT